MGDGGVGGRILLLPPSMTDTYCVSHAVEEEDGSSYRSSKTDRTYRSWMNWGRIGLLKSMTDLTCAVHAGRRSDTKPPVNE